MKLSIIIVSYNTKDILDTCLQTLKKNVGISPAEIIVIDNNSPDHSAEMVASRHPDVQLISNTQNKGFAEGVNQGLACAQGETILLLNPDTKTPENTIPALYDFLHKHPEAGIIGCQLRYMNNSLQNTFGNFPGIIADFFLPTGLYKVLPWGRLIQNKTAISQPIQVDWVGGAFQMFRKNLVIEIGPLDEAYCMYLEDIDFCYRARQKGYSNYYVPTHFIWHHLSASSGHGRKPLLLWLNARNSVYFQLKHRDTLTASTVKLLNLLQLFIQQKRWQKKGEKEIAAGYKQILRKLTKSRLADLKKPATLHDLHP